MKYKIFNLRSRTLQSLFTLVLSITAFHAYAQDPCPDAPEFETTQYFCSESAWAQIGEDADYLGDLPIFAEDTDYTLTWYRDSDLTDEVTNPKAELLVDGDTYYVTQTDLNDCESDALEIIVSETDCGCIKDPGFEDQEGSPTARGYEFYQFEGINNHKTCGQSMFGANQIQLGAVDGYTWQDNVALVTKGYDPTHLNSANNPTTTLPNHPRTNPDNPLSTHALRINRGAEYGGSDGIQNITSMTKKFIAGEVFAFSFSLIMQNPPGHTHEEMPFGQVNLYDEDDNLIQTRCLVSDASDCIFKHHTSNDILYSDWSCMKLNTSDHIGEPLRVEFITAYCTPTQHYSFMYVDDLYAGDDGDDICGELAFGHAVINSVSQVDANCYIGAPEVEVGSCDVSGESSNIPGFPIYVCGEYDAPISQGNPPSLDDIVLNIIQDNAVVGTITSAQPGTGANTFCFMVEEADLSVLPYGEFTFNVSVDFALDCGSEYHFFVEDRSIFDFCPSAGCPDMLQVCDLLGDGFTVFDLTDHGDMFYGTQWTSDDVQISYFEDELDAHNNTNQISDPTSYENSIAYDQTVYIRLDWDVEGASDDCYYLVALDLEVTQIPILEAWDDEVIFCDDEEINYPLMGTPSNLEDLKFVNYKWYKDDVQLPHSGSIYYAKEPGVYKVIVTEEECEIEQTIKISQVELDVAMPGDEIKVCDVDSYTITPSITSIGETTVDIDDMEFLWNTGDTSKDLTVTQSGVYTLEVSYGDCIYQESVSVIMSVRPEIQAIEDFKLCRDESEIVILDLSHPDVNSLHIEWYRDGGLIAEDVTQHEIVSPGIYKVVVGEALADDCHEELTFTVAYYDNENCIVPEGLSPNNDGYNDYLDLEYLDNQSGIQTLKIYNRHGVEVYSKDNYINEWHGQSKNDKILPVGVYYYIITLKDGSDDITGNIYLNY